LCTGLIFRQDELLLVTLLISIGRSMMFASE